jgi:hypothetical protein
MILSWPCLFKVRFFFCCSVFQILRVYWICPGLLPVVLMRVWTGEPPLSLFLDLSIEEIKYLHWFELRLVGKRTPFLIFCFSRMDLFFFSLPTDKGHLRFLQIFYLRNSSQRLNILNWIEKNIGCPIGLQIVYLGFTCRNPKRKMEIWRNTYIHFILFLFICLSTNVIHLLSFTWKYSGCSNECSPLLWHLSQ